MAVIPEVLNRESILFKKCTLPTFCKFIKAGNSSVMDIVIVGKIPPNLPLLKGGTIPLFGKEGRGEILWKWEIL